MHPNGRPGQGTGPGEISDSPYAQYVHAMGYDRRRHDLLSHFPNPLTNPTYLALHRTNPRQIGEGQQLNCQVSAAGSSTRINLVNQLEHLQLRDDTSGEPHLGGNSLGQLGDQAAFSNSNIGFNVSGYAANNAGSHDGIVPTQDSTVGVREVDQEENEDDFYDDDDEEHGAAQSSMNHLAQQAIIIAGRPESGHTAPTVPQLTAETMRGNSLSLHVGDTPASNVATLNVPAVADFDVPASDQAFFNTNVPSRGAFGVYAPSPLPNHPLHLPHASYSLSNHRLNVTSLVTQQQQPGPLQQLDHHQQTAQQPQPNQLQQLGHQQQPAQQPQLGQQQSHSTTNTAHTAPLMALESERNQTVVCVVCGGVCKVTHRPDLNGSTPDWMLPILVRPDPDHHDMQRQKNGTRMRTRPFDTDVMIQVQVTNFMGGCQGMELEAQPLTIDTRDKYMNIPIHKACFDIALRFCKGQARYEAEFHNPDGGAPGNILQLYEIWAKRAIATCPEGLMSKPILEANKYFGAPVFSNMTDYRKAMDEDRSLRRFLACPLAIPNITDLVVHEVLETMDGKDHIVPDTLSNLLKNINRMPREISDRILEAMEPFDEGNGPSLTPTRVLPPSLWKKRLFSGTLIPWLWDLSEEDLRKRRIEMFYEGDVESASRDEKEGAYIFDENMWDWELLCRKLAQPNVLDNGILCGMSNQLWNRRRIWKLLDAARLGHLLFSFNWVALRP
ncbi:hypothetical protein GGS21DRAFT_355346 [Xylaria nigripes]|nr:hypothetical protein GGS21DRAFT_355346 [Xylaria nigripes]